MEFGSEEIDKLQADNIRSTAEIEMKLWLQTIQSKSTEKKNLEAITEENPKYEDH